MSLKRRDFLTLSSLTGLGLGILGKFLWNQPVQSADLSKLNNAELDTNSFSTAQNSSSAPLLRFVSVADTGTGAQGQYAVSAAMWQHYQKTPYNLVILAGDNIYNNGEIEKIKLVFEDPYKQLLQRNVKFQACLGNHDIRTANGVPQVNYPAFNMQGKRYYTFRRDLVQFFALDTNHNADWQTQLTWLDQELGKSNALWKIVFGHHQIYASGHYGVNQPFIKTLVPLFKKHGVRLYINGHEHHYERTQPIDGITYLTCGGGAGTRPVGRSTWTAYSAQKLSFAAYEVGRDRISIKAIGTDHRVFDQGVITLA